MLIEWSRSNFREFSWRYKTSPYEILVAEMLLKRTTAKAVSRIYDSFLEKYPSVYDLAEAKIGEISDLLKPLGYNNKRAAQFKILSEHIISQNNGEFPCDIQSLKEIPFIGNYTACSILCFSHNIPYPMVDSNVIRIFSRVFLNSYDRLSARIIEGIATNLLPKDDFKKFNLSLLDLGGTVCIPRNPKCHVCPLATVCDYHNQDRNTKRHIV